MDIDPWTWDVNMVQDFFRHEAAKLMVDRPSGHLPPIDPFVEALGENDVDGASLLSDLDNIALRDSFAITSFRIRGTIQHIIHKLRGLSQGYSHRGDAAPPQTPTSLATPKLLAQPLPESNIAAQPPPIGENVREGEKAVEDDRGRKRRRLNPVNMLVAPETQNPSAAFGKTSGYLSDSHCDIDEVFYGSTSMGSEIGNLQPAGGVLSEDEGTELSESNFQLVGPQMPAGEAQFIYSSLRHLLANPETLNLTRSGRGAMAILPYRDGSQKTTRSATVIQFDQHGYCFAARERASLIDCGFLPDNQSCSSGEWDFLLQKYKGSVHEMPPYKASEHGGEAVSMSVSEETEESENSEEEPEVHADQGVAIINRYVNSRISDWAKKLPWLEAERAWSMWRRMKKSRSLRDALIAKAKSVIERFDRRLQKLVGELASEDWRNPDQLLKACGVLDVTIDEREEQRWMIDVWGRRKEPLHTVRARTTYPSTAQPYIRETGARSANFPPEPGDMLDVSPTTPTYEDATDFAESARPAGAADPESPEEDIASSTTGRNSDLEATKSPFVVPDDQPDVGPGHGETSANPNTATEHEQSVEEPLDYSSGSPDSAPAAASDPVGGHEWARPSSISGVLDGESSAEELASPSVFASTQKKIAEVQKPSRSSAPSIKPPMIDLTLTSSDEATPVKTPLVPKRVPPSKPARRRAVEWTAEPLDSKSAEVARWDIKELALNNDRNRLVIKVLHDEGLAVREALFKCITSTDKKRFLDELTNALPALGQKETSNHVFEPEVLQFARLAVVWHTSNPAWLKGEGDIPWQDLHKSRFQQEMAYDLLRKVLERKDTKLFKAPQAKVRSIQAEAEEDPSLAIIVSDGDAESVNTPHKKRKRKIAENAAAKANRRNAHDRMSRYNLAVESSLTEASQQEQSGSTLAHPLQINIDKDEDRAPIYVHQRIASRMKNHQIEGVRFLWREITAENEDAEQEGCILAHTMGLGKTMQTIALLVALQESAHSNDQSVREQLPKSLRVRATRNLRVLVLCPPVLRQNWLNEIHQWAGNSLGLVLPVESRQQAKPQIDAWFDRGGVLLIGYEQFRRLVSDSSKTKRLGNDAAAIKQHLLNDTQVVVADEAHNLKNRDASVSRCAALIATRSRVALTGTPMSNDVDEIYSLVSWVAPGYLGEPVEFKAGFSEPIKQGLFIDSSTYEKRRSLKKLAVLHHEIAPKVHRANITVLRGSLKAKVEFVLFVPLTEIQASTYTRCLAALLADAEKVNKLSTVMLFGWLAVLTQLTNHPLVFKRKMLDPPPPKKQKQNLPGDNASQDALETSTPEAMDVDEIVDPRQKEIESAADQDVYAMGFTEAIAQAVVQDIGDVLDPDLSAKTSLFVQLLDLSRQCGDKMLVFSMNLLTLEYLEQLLVTRGIRTGRIQGSMPMPKRLNLLEKFHEDDDFSVLLLSTRACGTGLNISCANRVVIFDFSFNPSHEEQAIGRTYRLGQQKPVFVYRFVSSGTFEANVYNKQLFKTSLAQRVVDKKNSRRNAERNPRDYLYQPQEVQQEDLTEWMGKDPQVLDKILEQHGNKDTYVRAIKTMETLQEDEKDAPLTEEERLEVNREIAEGRTRKGIRKAPVRSSASNAVTMASMVAIQSRQRGIATQPPPTTLMARSQAMPPLSTAPASQPFVARYPDVQPPPNHLNGLPPSVFRNPSQPPSNG